MRKSHVFFEDLSDDEIIRYVQKARGHRLYFVMFFEGTDPVYEAIDISKRTSMEIANNQIMIRNKLIGLARPNGEYDNGYVYWGCMEETNIYRGR